MDAQLSDSSFFRRRSDTEMTGDDVAARSCISKKERHMSRSLLLQSVIGHLALLEQKHPKKAASPVAKRAKKYIAQLRRKAA